MIKHWRLKEVRKGSSRSEESPFCEQVGLGPDVVLHLCRKTLSRVTSGRLPEELQLIADTHSPESGPGLIRRKTSTSINRTGGVFGPRCKDVAIVIGIPIPGTRCRLRSAAQNVYIPRYARSASRPLVQPRIDRYLNLCMGRQARRHHQGCTSRS
jgi:hypothetical protein